MSTTNTRVKPQDDPSRPANVLVGSCPSDTLNNAAAVLSAIQCVELSEMHEYVSLGMYLCVRSVDEALRWESARVQFERKPEHEVARLLAEIEAAAQ